MKVLKIMSLEKKVNKLENVVKRSFLIIRFRKLKKKIKTKIAKNDIKIAMMSSKKPSDIHFSNSNNADSDVSEHSLRASEARGRWMK
jgi:hypothetical protein